MKLDFQSLFWLHVFVHSCTYWLRPCTAPPPPAFRLIYTRGLYGIGQPRQTTSLCDPMVTQFRHFSLYSHRAPALTHYKLSTGALGPQLRADQIKDGWLKLDFEIWVRPMSNCANSASSQLVSCMERQSSQTSLKLLFIPQQKWNVVSAFHVSSNNNGCYCSVEFIFVDMNIRTSRARPSKTLKSTLKKELLGSTSAKHYC